MQKEEIHLKDIQRILFGQAPPEFLIEVLIRTLIIFALSLVTVKLLGKRMSGQISVMEMTVMVIIGALIAVPVQFPNRGILQGIVLLSGILTIYGFINWIGYKSAKVEMALHGNAIMLVKNNRLNLEEMSSANISREQVFAELRNRDVFNLGQVKRMYLEACGIISIYKEQEAKPGLIIFPPDDKPVNAMITEPDGDLQVCTNCGFVGQNNAPTVCTWCKCNEWTAAAKLKPGNG